MSYGATNVVLIETKQLLANFDSAKGTFQFHSLTETRATVPNLIFVSSYLDASTLKLLLYTLAAAECTR